MIGTGRNLSHRLIQRTQNTVQRLLDRQKVARIILLCFPCQISLRNRSQYIRNLTNVCAEADHGAFKYFPQQTNLIIGADTNLYFLAVSQSKLALFQPHSRLRNFGKRSRHTFFQINQKEQNTDNNHRHTDHCSICNNSGCLLLRLSHGYASEDQTFNLSVLSLSRDIGTQISLSQNIRLTHIGLALLQYNINQIGGQLGSHNAFPVFGHRAVCPRISLKNSKFATHALLHSVQYLVDVILFRYPAQLISKCICPVRTNLFLHTPNKGIVHINTDSYCKNYRNGLHDHYNIADLFPDTLSLSAAAFFHNRLFISHTVFLHFPKIIILTMLYLIGSVLHSLHLLYHKRGKIQSCFCSKTSKIGFCHFISTRYSVVPSSSRLLPVSVNPRLS